MPPTFPPGGSRYRYFYRNDVVLYRREGLRGWLWLLAKDAWHTVQVLCSPQGLQSLAHRHYLERILRGGAFPPRNTLPAMKLTETILHKAALYPVVAFDVFDTLIKRDVARPTDLVRPAGCRLCQSPAPRPRPKPVPPKAGK